MNKKTIKILSLILCLSIFLTACTGGSKTGDKVDSNNSQSKSISKEKNKKTTDNEGKDSKKAKTEKDHEASSVNNKKLAQLYKGVLDNIESYKFAGDKKSDVTGYRYTLVNMNDQDYPQLIVTQKLNFGASRVGVSRVMIFSYNEDFSKVIASDKVLSIGSAREGGQYIKINQDKKLNSLIYTDMISGTGLTERERITATNKGNRLELDRKLIWKGDIYKNPDLDAYTLVLYEARDNYLLDRLAKTPDGGFKESLHKFYKNISRQNASKKSSSNNNKKDTKESPTNKGKQVSKDSLKSRIEAEKKKGNMVATGLVRVFSHKEMKKFNNVPPEALQDMGEQYVILVLSKEAAFKVVSGDGQGYRTRRTNIISLPYDMMKFRNNVITISFGPDDGHWQSDFSLPLNAPRMKSVKLIN